MSGREPISVAIDPKRSFRFFAAVCYNQRMRQCLTLLILIWFGTPAVADEAPPWKPSKIIVCEEIQSASPAPICARTCATWARSQPDFQVSLDACIANCQPKQKCSEVQVR